jgi:hypothetical protein
MPNPNSPPKVHASPFRNSISINKLNLLDILQRGPIRTPTYHQDIDAHDNDPLVFVYAISINEALDLAPGAESMMHPAGVVRVVRECFLAPSLRREYAWS